MTSKVDRRSEQRLRKLLNRLPEENRKHVVKAVELSAKRIRNDAVAIALGKDIYRTGDMVESIDYKLFNRGLGAVIGPGAQSAFVRKSAFANLGTRAKSIKRSQTRIRHKKAQMNFMKGYWAEITVPEHVQKPERPFMNAAYEDNKEAIRRYIRAAMDKTLRSVTNG